MKYNLINFFLILTYLDALWISISLVQGGAGVRGNVFSCFRSAPDDTTVAKPLLISLPSPKFKSFTKKIPSPRKILRNIPKQLDAPSVEPVVQSELTSRQHAPELLLYQSEELQLWKLQLGVSYFIEQLELRVSSIAGMMIEAEGDKLSSEELDALIKSFKTTDPNLVLPHKMSIELGQKLIKDVYRWFNCNDRTHKANSYLQNEYEMFKRWGNVDGWEPEGENLLQFMESLESKAKKHYSQYDAYLEEWRSQTKVIQEHLKSVLPNMSKYPNNATRQQQEMLQIKARCGDPWVYNTFEKAVLENWSSKKLQQTLLDNIRGIRSKNYEYIFTRTLNLFNDIKTALHQPTPIDS